MSSFLNFAFGATLILIWIIAGGFITQANVKLSQYKNDQSLSRAYWASFWAAFITWTLIGISLILVALSVLGVFALFGSGAGEAGVAVEGTEVEALAKTGAKSKKSKGLIGTGVSLGAMIFLFCALALVILTGVLAAIAASTIAKSSTYNSSNSTLQKAYKDCIISACMCLGAAGLLIIGVITYILVEENKKKKKQIPQQPQPVKK